MPTQRSDSDELVRSVGELVDAWCHRRTLTALRFVLRAYPVTNQLTDGWADLMTALQDVRSFVRQEITVDELTKVDACISEIEAIVYRR